MKNRIETETEKTTAERNNIKTHLERVLGRLRWKMKIEVEVEVEVEKKRVGSKSEIRRSGSPQ